MREGGGEGESRGVGGRGEGGGREGGREGGEREREGGRKKGALLKIQILSFKKFKF